MRALTVTADTPAGGLDNALLSDIAAHAAALDLGEESSRRSFAALGEAGCSVWAPRATPMVGCLRWQRSSARSPRSA